MEKGEQRRWQADPPVRFPPTPDAHAYGALETNEQSPVYRYAKRAYFIIDKTGTVKYVKIMDSPLNLLSADEVLKALKDSGAAL